MSRTEQVTLSCLGCPSSPYRCKRMLGINILCCKLFPFFKFVIARVKMSKTIDIFTLFCYIENVKRI